MQRYTIEDKLGEGGMGVVYRARQNDLDRLVAIKYLLPDGELTETALKRFKREMDVLIALSHPNIIRVFDAGEADGKLFYVMEMLVAHDLGAIMHDKGMLAAEPVASVLVQILEALVYIHGQGIVHRDIKPANIMLEENGRAVLMDFGLVRKVDGTMLTAEGKLLGTPRYFAPEYIRGEEGTPSCDIWALGVTAYELLTGERPFSGTNLQELALAIIKREPDPIERIAPQTPPELACVVHRMLEKDPKKRWHTAAECLAALRTAMEPRDLQRSAELSQELSPVALQKLLARRGADAPAPRSRATGKASRVTGNTPRVTGTTPRVTASRVPALTQPPAPAHSYWPAFVLVCVVVLVAGLVQLLRGPVDAPAGTVSTVSASAPIEAPHVDYETAERLVATFRTPDASVWTMDCGEGLTATDKAPTREHRLEVIASPLRAPEKIVFTRDGASAVEVRPPPSPLDRVRGLEAALAKLGVNAGATDKLWETIRLRIPEWQATSEMSLEFSSARKEKSSPSVARRAVRKDASILKPYLDYVKLITDNPDAKRHLVPVLSTASSLLMSDRVPQARREELLSALFRLDLVDGLGEYMGEPPPFKIAEVMRPAIEITVQKAGLAPPLPPQLAPLYVPGRNPNDAEGKPYHGAVVHHDGENFMAIGGGGLQAAVASEGSLNGWEHTEVLPLGTAQPAGPGGRRLHFWVLGLSTQLFPYLVPRGYKHGFALRMHGEFYGFQQYSYFQVTLRGPLAEPSYWDLYVRRIFQLSSRLYYGVGVAGAESLPR